MKLLVDCHVFDGKFQGTRTYIEGLYTHMIHHRDIDFFFAATEEKKLKRIFGEADNIHYIHLNHEGSINRLLFDFPKLIKQNDIDYAHYQYISPIVKNCKEIVTIHDLLFLDYPQYFPWLYRVKNKYLFQRSAKRADVLLTVSNFSRDEIVRHFGICKDRIHITYNSILPVSENVNDINLKDLYGLDKYILTVSRIEPRKNHLNLLRTFVELKLYDKDYKLVLVGSKDLDYQDFFNYLDRLSDKIKEKILFLQVPFNELVALYKNASLFVFPSFGEGFGIPPIEAIAYGCPLLCSNATAMAEFGLPEEICFNPKDLEEMKRKMLIQLNTPVAISSYEKFVLEKYDWQRIADGYYDILQNEQKK